MDWASPARPVGQHAHNLALVSRLIAGDGPVSRAELAQRSGLTKTTVTQLAGELLDAGLVRELGTARHGGPGRPATHLVVNVVGPVGIGMQIEADHVAGCLVDLTGRVRDRAMRRIDDPDGGPGVAVKAAEPVLRRLLASADARDSVVAGIAVGVPGRVDGDGRADSVELGWVRVPLASLLTRRLEMLSGGIIPVEAHDGFRLAALAERWFGGADPTRPLVTVAGESSLGIGVIDGPGWERGFSGPLGHVRVRRGGDRCHCGARGCLDTAAGPRFLLRVSDSGAPVLSRLRGGESRMRALARNPEASAVLRRAASALGDALAGLLVAHGSASVVLGGHLAPLGSAFAEQVAAALGRRLPDCAPAVTTSSLRGDAVALAAGATVTRRLIENPARWLAS
ncbi:ROK family transcriptional regulator [Saccharomonospora xinjiangensis]|uniref:ROK family transcriptional regulator n=1 Tax=Saccharomonospora xinjiangensis TaxID=75294 RepID=UPI0010703C6D|nr:ROK family transcriptional regulator [Saccharomonospora xinjiangensis]QBQ60293.1 N-acetylglucosamine repressor [Saccharomonospora xinjiangensis]